MEPRLQNLLLNDRNTSDRHGVDHLSVQYLPAAVFPSATLPAIRPLYEDEDTRGYRNEIDSLQLPEIDWPSITSPLHPPPSSSSIGAAYPEEQQQPRPQQPTKKSTKSAVPLAEVLNSVSPEARNIDSRNIDPSLSFSYPHSEPRKRRRIDDPGTRILPKPSQTATAKGTTRQPRLPPLLVPLHEPPPDARIIPSITTEGFRERRRDTVADAISRAVEKEPITTPVPPPQQSNAPKPDNTPVTEKQPKVAKTRKKWSEEETSDLVKGVSKFGIGSWKKILQHADYKFNARTAVDLKDRCEAFFLRFLRILAHDDADSELAFLTSTAVQLQRNLRLLLRP